MGDDTVSKNQGLADIARRSDLAGYTFVNALAPIADFRPAYWQLEPMERKFVDGFVKDIEDVADKSGRRLLAVLQGPIPFELDQRGIAMLARPMVRAAIAQRIHELSDLYDISIMRTLKENAAIAYSNISNYIEIDPNFGTPDINLSRCTPEQLSAIKMFEIEDRPRGGRKIKFQLHDKLSALGNLMRYQGLLSEDNPHWRQQEQSVKPVNGQGVLPANVDDDQAAALYAREIGG